MSNRLGLLDPDELDPKQKTLYNDFARYTTSKYGDRYARSLLPGTLVPNWSSS